MTVRTSSATITQSPVPTRYSSLSEDLAVKTGDTVTLGQPIGCVGDTALVETAMGTHVHFGVTYQDTPMDPNEFLNMN